MFSEHGITAQDVENARLGYPSPFYGLKNLPARLPRIQAFLDELRSNAGNWLATVENVLAGLFPDESLDICVFPIIGYDMGIGLDGAVCMNCNHVPYLDEPLEFLFYIIHECVHVVYERHHHVPALAEVQTPVQWRRYFALWMQNEGFAVYAPLRLRQVHGYLDERDYRVLCDEDQMNLLRLSLLDVLRQLDSDEPLTRAEYLECCFGDQRLTYRMGCALIQRIEDEHGMQAVRQAFTMDGEAFLASWRGFVGAGM